MLGRREMIAVKYFDLITGYPPRVTGSQCLDHRLGKGCGIAHEGGGHAGFDTIELVIEGGSRHPKCGFLGLIGRMYGRMDPEDDFTQEVQQGETEYIAGILCRGE